MHNYLLIQGNCFLWSLRDGKRVKIYISWGPFPISAKSAVLNLGVE